MNKTVLSKLMKDYDESPSVSEIGGASIKKFVLFKTEHFSDLVKIIKKKENSYVTYANDLIKSGYTPEYLSCMMKRCGGKSAYEVVSSKFANEMNIPTSYAERFDYEGIEYLLSIDFLNSAKNLSRSFLSSSVPRKQMDALKVPLMLNAVITAQGLFFAAPATKAENGGFCSNEKAMVSIDPTLLTESTGFL